MIEQDKTVLMIQQNGNFPPPNIPADNPITEARSELGRRLFYDKLLSSDGTVSCASCHLQSDGFADGNRFSTGVNGAQGERQGMAIFNLARHNGGFFWDGRAATLREQALGPIENPFEMNETLGNVVNKLSNSDEYPAMFTNAFGDQNITADRIGLALENFMLTIVSNDSKYDRYLSGSATLSESERRLFLGVDQGNGPGGGPGNDPRCVSCYGGANFDSPQFFNIGLDTDAEITDLGREYVTGNPNDRGKFKTTSLRNIAVTGSYMHDGRFNTLDQVLQFYNTGVQNSNTLAPQLQNAAQNGLGFSVQDREDIVNFLETLTNLSYLNNPEYSDPN